ncbi:MAG: citrate/2-methylcitrate synthase [Candidatus Saganbacteria bacterium]|nr:citrate/2-methylcitrate synthase [Candidatus Saganbacteria bacterium]
MDKQTENFVKKAAKKIVANDKISQDLYRAFNVKRGLRNEDGSGVLVGLTGISTVIGFEKVDEEVKPVEGRLEYRGMNVADIINGLYQENRYGYEEVAYLLLFGELPNQKELDEFIKIHNKARNLPQNFPRDIILRFRSHNIMNSLARSVLALYSTDPHADDLDIENQIRQAISLVAKFPVIIAYAYHGMLHKFKGKSLFIQPPNKKLSTAENFFYMMRQNHEYTETEARVLDVALILHADHGGGNNSTFTTRVISSSATDAYSAIAGAVGSLKGPLHGGANKSVMEMMKDIKKNVKDWADRKEVKEYLLKILRGEVGNRTGKIYGFGHAVYTKSDPRAVVLKDYAIRLAEEKKKEDELALYMLIEELVPEVFAEFKHSDKPICANVDFYSGFVYRSLGLEEDLYTPLFAMARISGWMAHRIEELTTSKKIIRPAYKNVSEKMEYVPLAQRKVVVAKKKSV